MWINSLFYDTFLTYPVNSVAVQTSTLPRKFCHSQGLKGGPRVSFGCRGGWGIYMKWKLNPVNPDIASNIIRHHQIKEVRSCPSTPKKIYLPSWNQLNPNELRPHLYSCRALIQPRRAASLGVIMFWNPPFTHPTPRIRNTDHQWMADFHMECYLLVSACFRLAGWISCLTNCAGITRQCFTSRLKSAWNLQFSAASLPHFEDRLHPDFLCSRL